MYGQTLYKLRLRILKREVIKISDKNIKIGDITILINEMNRKSDPVDLIDVAIKKRKKQHQVLKEHLDG